MRVQVKPRNTSVDFQQIAIDVDIRATVDHLITHLTLKYNTIDATTLEAFFRGRKLPFESELYGIGVREDDEILIQAKESGCCLIL